MTKAELIKYIRENDQFYKGIDLENRPITELKKLKELVEAIIESNENQKKRNGRK